MCAETLSLVNVQPKQETDWKAIEQDRIHIRFPKWIYKNDPEAYAYDKYSQGFAHLIIGSPFQHTNFPPEHEFVPWTIDEVNQDIDNRKRVEDSLDGDGT